MFPGGPGGVRGAGRGVHLQPQQAVADRAVAGEVPVRRRGRQMRTEQRPCLVPSRCRHTPPPGGAHGAVPCFLEYRGTANPSRRQGGAHSAPHTRKSPGPKTRAPVMRKARGSLERRPRGCCGPDGISRVRSRCAAGCVLVRKARASCGVRAFCRLRSWRDLPCSFAAPPRGAAFVAGVSSCGRPASPCGVRAFR